MRISSIFNLVFVCGVSLFYAGQTSADVIFQDNFDLGVTSSFTFLDRNGATEIANASYSVVDEGTLTDSPISILTGNGVLAQTVANFDFRRGPINNAPTLGTIALSGSGSIGGVYSISVDFDSLEENNDFQDHALVFAYEDEDNFLYIDIARNDDDPDFFRLNEVVDGERTTGVSQFITFSQDVTSAELSVDTLTGTISFSYDGAADVQLATGLTIAAGQNGVGSNDDAFAIDNFIVTNTAAVPEPGSLALLGLVSLGMMVRRRK